VSFRGSLCFDNCRNDPRNSTKRHEERPTAFCLLPTAFCLLPSAFCPLLSAFCLLPGIVLLVSQVPCGVLGDR
jgi:hypothetical protein